MKSTPILLLLAVSAVAVSAVGAETSKGKPIKTETALAIRNQQIKVMNLGNQLQSLQKSFEEERAKMMALFESAKKDDCPGGTLGEDLVCMPPAPKADKK